MEIIIIKHSMMERRKSILVLHQMNHNVISGYTDTSLFCNKTFAIVLLLQFAIVLLLQFAIVSLRHCDIDAHV